MCINYVIIKIDVVLQEILNVSIITIFDILVYLTLCTFSFEITESHLSNTRCIIQDVVSPQCGDKRMARRCMRRSLPNYFDMTSYH